MMKAHGIRCSARGRWQYNGFGTGQGGAIADLDEGATAFTGRSAWLRVTAECGWSDPALDDAAAAWCRKAMALAGSETLEGRYVNEVFEDGTDAAEIYGAAKVERLAAIKAVWDPDNAFRMNHNIEPRLS